MEGQGVTIQKWILGEAWSSRGTNKLLPRNFLVKKRADRKNKVIVNGREKGLLGVKAVIDSVGS